MSKESMNRLHPLIKFTINGNILKEFVEEKILSSIIGNNNIERLVQGTKIVLDNKEYKILKIIIEYSEFMRGDYGIPTNYEGEFDNFNTVINVVLINIQQLSQL